MKKLLLIILISMVAEFAIAQQAERIVFPKEKAVLLNILEQVGKKMTIAQ